MLRSRYFGVAKFCPTYTSLLSALYSQSSIIISTIYSTPVNNMTQNTCFGRSGDDLFVHVQQQVRKYHNAMNAKILQAQSQTRRALSRTNHAQQEINRLQSQVTRKNQEMRILGDQNAQLAKENAQLKLEIAKLHKQIPVKFFFLLFCFYFVKGWGAGAERSVSEAEGRQMLCLCTVFCSLQVLCVCFVSALFFVCVVRFFFVFVRLHVFCLTR